ncbi:hypothetical protein ABES04_16665, partial [Brevibacillus parabrevis]
MKALTIHQPWATLIALGEKRLETRSWATKYSGPLRDPRRQKVDKEVCQQEPFRIVLASHGYTADNLPTGAVVATATLKECLRIVTPGTGQVAAYRDSDDAMVPIDGQEKIFGWFERGRFVWKRADVKPIDPVTAVGKQGLWNWHYGTCINCKGDNGSATLNWTILLGSSRLKSNRYGTERMS